MTLAIIENGSTALTQDNCRNADDISAEYAALDSAKASDVAFARFLVGICKSTDTATSTERSALLKTLDSELQPTDFRLQFARQIDAALDRRRQRHGGCQGAGRTRLLFELRDESARGSVPDARGQRLRKWH